MSKKTAFNLCTNKVSDMEASVNRAIIFRTGSIGDAIVSVPAINKLNKQFPSADFVLLTNVNNNTQTSAASLIFDGWKTFSKCLHFSLSFTGKNGAFSLLKELRRMDADTLFYLGPARENLALIRYVIFFRLAGIKNIVGLPWSDIPTGCCDFQSQLHEHESNRILKSLGLPSLDLSDSLDWNFPLSSSEKSITSSLQVNTDQFVVICLGGKIKEKHWPVEKWRELLSSLSEELEGVSIVAVGSVEDRDKSELVLSEFAGSAHNLCGELTARQSLGLLEKAQLIVSHDTGPIHMAAMMGVPCVGIYGDRDPAGKWYPFTLKRVVIQSRLVCHGEQVTAYSDDRSRNIGDIEVSRVRDGILNLLNAS